MIRIIEELRYLDAAETDDHVVTALLKLETPITTAVFSLFVGRL